MKRLPVEYTAEAVRGYRVWGPQAEASLGRVGLSSRVWPYVWTAGINTTVCMNNCALGRPSLDCTCGFYAWHHPALAMLSEPPAVFGVVEGGGHVISAQFGWRAEKALIVGLTTHLEWVADLIADKYPEIPVFGYADDMLDAFPPTKHMEGFVYYYTLYGSSHLVTFQSEPPTIGTEVFIPQLRRYMVITAIGDGDVPGAAHVTIAEKTPRQPVFFLRK